MTILLKASSLPKAQFRKLAKAMDVFGPIILCIVQTFSERKQNSNYDYPWSTIAS